MTHKKSYFSSSNFKLYPPQIRGVNHIFLRIIIKRSISLLSLNTLDNHNTRVLVRGDFAVNGNLIDCHLKNRTIVRAIANNDNAVISKLQGEK